MNNKPVLTKDFSQATCNVLGIDFETHPVLGVDVKTANGGIVEIHVRFAVPYGLLNQIDLAMRKN